MDTRTDELSTVELRQDIAQQRRDIGRDLEAIGDRLSPGRMAGRGRERARRRATGWRDRLMGTVDEARGRVGEAMPSAPGSGDAAPAEVVADKVDGSPLVAGMVAFGIGFIAGSVLPASRKEQQLARQVEPQIEQLAQGVASTAREAGEHLAPKVAEEVDAAKQEATDAAQSVAGSAKQEMASARDDVKSST